MKISKVSALAVGIVLCGIGMTSNRQYDIKHGYYAPNAKPAEVARPVVAQRRQAPANRSLANAPAVTKPQVTRRQAVARPAAKPAVGEQRALVRPNWLEAQERDHRMQQAALDYNRRFDMRYGQ